ncbi:MAG: acyl dehydratase [Candidatus Azotimanducaceae bacterium]
MEKKNMSSAMENAAETLSAKIGVASEPTDWFEMTQDRINTFADATMDQQWIHVDPERAKAGPFGTPIAHGQLTMSVMSFLPGGEGVGLPQLDGMTMGVNLGWNKVRFMNPVPVGCNIRTIGKIKSVEAKGPMLEVVNEMTVEIEGQEKPACVAESVLRIGF